MKRHRQDRRRAREEVSDRHQKERETCESNAGETLLPQLFASKVHNSREVALSVQRVHEWYWVLSHALASVICTENVGRAESLPRSGIASAERSSIFYPRTTIVNLTY